MTVFNVLVWIALICYTLYAVASSYFAGMLIANVVENNTEELKRHHFRCLVYILNPTLLVVMLVWWGWTQYNIILPCAIMLSVPVFAELIALGIYCYRIFEKNK